jgi:hypothetical protein
VDLEVLDDAEQDENMKSKIIFFDECLGSWVLSWTLS